MTIKEPPKIHPLPVTEAERIKAFQKRFNQQAMLNHGIKREEMSVLSAGTTGKSIFTIVDNLTQELEGAKHQIQKLEEELTKERQAHELTAWNLRLTQAELNMR